MKSILGIGVAAVGLLAFLFGLEDAQAAPGGLVISADDQLGQAEAQKLAAMLKAAVDKCSNLTVGPEGVPAEAYGELGGCDVNAVMAAANAIDAYPWKHAAVAAQAHKEASALRSYAQAAAGYANQAEAEAVHLDQLSYRCDPSGLTLEGISACVDKMYAAAAAIRAYPWTTVVGEAAEGRAAELEAEAKQLEDQAHAQNMASMNWELAE